MADDDREGTPAGPEELFAPSGPRRSNFTPPTNDADTLEAAANVFNDDAIAAALAAELAKVASGPVPVVRPVPVEAVPVEPVPVEAVPIQPVPVQVVPVEPAPASSPAGEPPTGQPGPATQVEPPQPPAPQQPEPARPEASPFAPVAAQTSPIDASDDFRWAPQPPADEASRPTYDLDADPYPDEGAPPAFFGTPAADFVPTAVPTPDAPPPPAASSIPTPSSAPVASSAPAPDSWAPAPEPSATPVDQPPPYLGAPAPTVPPADAPPPPGYESSYPSAPSFAPENERPRPPDEAALPSAPDVRPRRRALADEDLFRTLHEDGSSDNTLSAIEQLQAQLELRDREAREYATWEQSMLAMGTPDALAAVAEARAESAGGTEAPALAPPEQSAQPEPVPPSAPVPPAPVASAPVPPAPAAPAPVSVDPPVSSDPPTPASSTQAPRLDEPSLTGTAFDDLFARLSAPPAPTPTPAPAPVDPPAFDLTQAPASEPFDLAPPPLDETVPPGSGVPDAPVFLEPSAPVQPAVSAEQLAHAEPPELIEPAPAAPAGSFDSFLAGGDRDENPNAQPSTWLPPGTNQFTEPTIDAATGDRRPFGEGVERDDAVDPSDSIFGAAYAPVSVDTAGVAQAGEAVELESQPILIQRAEPLPPLVSMRAPKVFSSEVPGIEPTPLEQRVGRSARLFWLWFAPNSSIVAVVFGGMIFALGMSLRQAIVATLGGVALSFLPLGLGTLAGKRSGQPTMIVSRATFGVVGNILPAIIGLLSRLFWAAALLWLLGAGMANILTGATLTDGFTTQQLTMILMVIGFILAIVIACFGYGLIAQVQRIISILSAVFVIGFVVLTFQYVNIQTALTVGDGPWILAVTGAVLVFSFVGLVWANSSADLARYQRVESSGASSMLLATFGAALPSFVLIAYGAVLASSNPKIAAGLAVSPLDTLGRLLPVWYPAPFLLATGLSLLSGTVIALYSGGFALQAVGLRVKRSLSTIIVGALVLVIAAILALSITDYTQLFRDFATTVAVPVAAWAGMFAAEMMIRNRRFDSASLARRGGVYADVRWPNVIALVAITVLGLGFLSASVPWLSWEGFLFSAVGVSLSSDLAATDLGVFVALLLGLIFPIVAGVPAIRRQESAERPAE